MPGIASSARAPDEADGTDEPEAAAARAARRRELLVDVGVVALVLVAGWLMTSVHRPGHYWGDDFALYLRQADSIVGAPGVDTVIDDNHAMLAASESPNFSPPLYPWGWPLLLALPVAVVGIDVDTLALVSVAAFLAAVVAWYRIARPRLGPATAIGGAAVLALSPVYVGWTDLLHSELPFMAVTFAALVWLDRCRGRWLERWGPPLAMGALAAASFSVRREGLALLVAVAVAQAADGAVRDVVDARRNGTVARVAARAAAPFAAFAGVVIALQIVLPSTLLPSYDGTSVTNLVRFREQYLTAFGDAWGPGGATWGLVLVTLAAIGYAWRMRTAWRRDAPLLAYLVVVAVIGGSFFVPSSRYVATVTPLLWYGALQVPAAMRALVGRVRDRDLRRTMRGSIAVTTTCLVVAVGWYDAGRLVERARLVDDLGGRVVWGPDHPAARAMFAEIRRTTDDDEVIGFFKARAMTQRTDRRSVQVGESRSPMVRPERFDVLVLDRDDPSFAEVERCTSTFARTWSNTRFVIYDVVPDANAC